MRTIVDIPEAEVRKIDSLSKAKGVSRAELIRRAIAQYLEAHTPANQDVFGAWAGRVADGRTYEDELRDEWSRR